MSKRITTRWYIGAWVIWVIAVIAMFVMARGGEPNALPAGVIVARVIAGIAGLVMFVMWIGALVKLGIQHAWGWFVAVLLLHLFALGIIGMVAYLVAGPEDTEEVVTRPTAVG